MDYLSINYEPWKIVKRLGQGSFGSVYEIERQEFGETYKAALKVISIPQSDSEIAANRADGMDNKSMTVYYDSVVKELTHEFALLSKLKGHTNIVSYEDHKVVQHKDGIGWDIYIRMELLTPLTDVSSICEFSEEQAIKLGIDICNALVLCSHSSIIHRDIKPDNIFISETGDFELGDFGIARTASKTMSNMSRKGTPNYMAPEIYLNRAYNANVDIYSLGIVLYQLMNARRLPFIPEQVTIAAKEASLGRRMSGEVLPPPQNASPQFADIILKACAFDPKNRYEDAASMKKDLQKLLGDKDAKIDMARIKAEIATMKNNMNDGQFNNNSNGVNSQNYSNNMGGYGNNQPFPNNMGGYSNNQSFPNNMYAGINQNYSNGNGSYGSQNVVNNQGMPNNTGGFMPIQTNNMGEYGNVYGNNVQGTGPNNINPQGVYPGSGYANQMNDVNNQSYNNQFAGGNSQSYNGWNHSQTMNDETILLQQPDYNLNAGSPQGKTDKSKKNNTMLMVMGGIVAVLLLVLIVVISGKGTKNSDVAEVSEQKSADEVVDESVEVELIEEADEVVEEVAPESSNAVVTSDDWKDFTIEFMGKVIALPAKYSEFSDLGWTVYSSRGDVSETDNLSAGENIRTYLSNGAGKISVDIFNPTGNLQPISECKIYGLNIYARDNLDIKLAKGITVLSSADEITSAYGKPGEQQNGDGYVVFKYLGVAGDYLDAYYNRITFEINDDTTYNNIEIRNRVITDDDATAISEERPAYLSTYKAPTDIGSDPTKPVFRLAGGNYQLPCPLSAFTDQGWEVVHVFSQYLGAMNRQTNALTIKKDDIKLGLEMVNPDNVMHYIEDCMVGAVRFDEITFKKAGADDYLQLPSGLTNKDLATRSWVANGYSLFEKYLDGLTITREDSDSYECYEFYNGDYSFDSSIHIQYRFSKKYTDSYTVSIKCYNWEY